MGHSKEQLLAILKELEIGFEQYEHPVVETVKAALEYLGNVDSAFCKNLFLKDKKNRYYIVSALSETKVDMKVLSQRLGLGKGGIRIAPDETLAEILQVPKGCVTPFALVNESARHVSLLLDQGLRSQNRILFHPLSNDMSIALSTIELDKFLNSIGRSPAYVDLEANPSIGKDQPPDLATLVPSSSIANQGAATISVQTAVPQNQFANGQTVEQPVEAQIVNNTSAIVKDVRSTTPKAVLFGDTHKFVEEILNKTSNLILSEITEASMKEHGDQLGAVASDNIRKRLSLELNNLAMIFKSSTYGEGFHAGTHCRHL